MTDEKMALFELIEKRADVDFVREMLAFAAERLMSFEAEAATGAAYSVKSPDRTAQRNGYRERTWGEADLKTIWEIVFPPNRVGAIDLKVPRLRTGSYLPSFLDPRKTAEKARVAVIQEAYVQGVSTRGVDDLVRAMPGVPMRQAAWGGWRGRRLQEPSEPSRR